MRPVYLSYRQAERIVFALRDTASTLQIEVDEGIDLPGVKEEIAEYRTMISDLEMIYHVPVNDYEDS